jgi:hypothetical protein
MCALRIGSDTVPHTSKEFKSLMLTMELVQRPKEMTYKGIDVDEDAC